MKVEKVCFSCGQVTSIECDESGYSKWINGEKIQHAMPSLSVMEREALISSMCFDCQEDFFNMPKPGNESKFGKRLGECDCCGRAVWEKDINPDGTFICKSCGETSYT
jgi:hypothetical protein